MAQAAPSSTNDSNSGSGAHQGDKADRIEDKWSATKYNNTASFVYSDAYTRPTLDLLQAKEGERILDFGCGSGELTKALADVVGPKGLVIGLDSSQSMIDKTKENGVKYAIVSDVQSINWDLNSYSGKDEWMKNEFQPGSFDAVFSNAALHWCCSSPISVLEHAWKALKPGGRFVVEMGGFTNIVGVRAAVHKALSVRGIDPKPLDPWFFPSDSAHRAALEKVGFQVETIGLFPRLTHVPNGLKAWLDLFVRSTVLANLTDEVANEIMDEVVKDCEVDMKDDQGQWHIMYVRLRWKAVKPLQTSA